MGLDNSTVQPPLPGDLQAQIENAQNRVSMLEAEDVRLLKLVGSKKAEVNALHAELKASEEKLNSLRKEKADMALEINTRHEELNSLRYDIQTANHELEEATRQKTDALTIVEAKNRELADRTAKLHSKELDFEYRSHELSQKESNHRQKVDRLLDAMK